MDFLSLNDGRKELYQWDRGRTATVSMECDKVHFSNLNYGSSLAVEVSNGIVELPNQLLTSGANLYCWAFSEDENGFYTKKEQTLKVLKRPKPSDYLYDVTEVINFENAVNDALAKAKESGEFKGEKGDTGEMGPIGPAGPQGVRGADGHTPQYGVDYGTPEQIADIANQTYDILADDIQKMLDGKVDKVEGMGLSSNDYDNATKVKVDAIPEDAKYTDTVYDDTEVKQSISQIKDDISDKFDYKNPQELTEAQQSAIQSAIGIRSVEGVLF